MKTDLAAERIVWIDYARAGAILLMISYHAAFNLDLLKLMVIDVQHGPWLWASRVVQYTFLFLVGISLGVSCRRFHKAGRSFRAYFHYQAVRAVKLFAVAMGVTLVTWLAYPDAYVRFGILHLISVSIVIGASLAQAPLEALAVAALLVTGGFMADSFSAPNNWLVFLNLKRPDFYTFDFFPVFPWTAVVLVGVALCPMLEKTGLLALKGKAPGFIAFLSRNSLTIYLVHLPLIWGALKVFSLLS